MRMPSKTTFAFASLTTLLAGCSDGEQSGALTIDYRFRGAGSTCESLEVTDVRVTIDDGLAMAEAPCDLEDPRILMDQVPSGRRDILVEGIAYDENGEIRTADNLGTLDEPSPRIEVLAGSSRNVDVVLTPTPATFRFLFDIESPAGVAYPNCADSEVKSFEVAVLEGPSEILSHEFVYCDAAADYQPIPDPQRAINGNDVNGIEVVVKGESSNITTLIPPEFEPPGPGRTVDFRVNCQGTDCELEFTGVEPTQTGGGDGGTGGGTGGDGSGTG